MHSLLKQWFNQHIWGNNQLCTAFMIPRNVLEMWGNYPTDFSGPIQTGITFDIGLFFFWTPQNWNCEVVSCDIIYNGLEQHGWFFWESLQWYVTIFSPNVDNWYDLTFNIVCIWRPSPRLHNLLVFLYIRQILLAKESPERLERHALKVCNNKKNTTIKTS